MKGSCLSTISPPPIPLPPPPTPRRDFWEVLLCLFFFCHRGDTYRWQHRRKQKKISGLSSTAKQAAAFSLSCFRIRDFASLAHWHYILVFRQGRGTLVVSGWKHPQHRTSHNPHRTNRFRNIHRQHSSSAQTIYANALAGKNAKSAIQSQGPGCGGLESRSDRPSNDWYVTSELYAIRECCWWGDTLTLSTENELQVATRAHRTPLPSTWKKWVKTVSSLHIMIH